ncbi:unnamed protein product, partial [Ectocarpus sp. 8 AP-2014]
SEQQARKAAADKAAAAASKPAAKPAGRQPEPVADTVTTDGSTTASQPVSDPVVGGTASLATGVTRPVADIPDAGIAPTQSAATPETLAEGGEADWGLLAALAALLGVGGAGAYAAARRRKNRGRNDAETLGRDPLPASMEKAIMPELRREQADPAPAEQVTAQPT